MTEDRPGYEPEQRDMGRPVSKWLKIGFLLAFVVPMAVVLLGSIPNARSVPPYPSRVVSEGATLTDKASIMRGQHAYQRYGLMDHGSIWGHGSLRGMDFSARTLHLMGEEVRSQMAGDYGMPYDTLSVRDKATVDALTTLEIKTNTYDKESGELVLSPAMASAYQRVVAYWDDLFLRGDELHGFLPNTVKSPGERRDLAAFFFWTGWAAGTKAPGSNLTYTNNWPADRSVGNVAPDDAIAWSFGGILSLFVVLGLVVYIVHRYRFFIAERSLVKLSEAMAHSPITPSQRKTGKYLGVVVLLFIAQIFMGGLLAHYTVHPGSFFLKSVAQWLPFSLVKTWHLQLGIFWIAVAWVASALYIAPLIGRREPAKQGLLVDLLFGAVVLVVFGSLIGEAASIKGLLKGVSWFWVGHQGWEYLELGRLWQILLFVGLLGWLVITYRAVAGRLRGERDRAGLLHFYLLSAVLVVLFFGFGLTYGPNTHLSVADYWRWFVVHIWVEGIFEFFAVATAALLFVMLGLVSRESALRAAYLTAILSFSAGIIGMSHHFYWFGQSSVWIALGSVFSSLEPIPLIMLASRGWMEYKSISAAGGGFAYKWPLLFLVASSFWNFLGGGVFGFVINLPIINYYEHATYLTSNHGHTALFGTYGMLAIALALFVWRGLVRPEYWREGWLKLSFWGLNIGLALMFLIALLPVGILEFATAYRDGLWLAKSAEFFNRPIVQLLGNLRAIPDTVLIVLGAFPLAVFTAIAFFHMKPCSEGVCQTIFDEGQPQEGR